MLFPFYLSFKKAIKIIAVKLIINPIINNVLFIFYSSVFKIIRFPLPKQMGQIFTSPDKQITKSSGDTFISPEP
jgi:hypothetical protein